MDLRRYLFLGTTLGGLCCAPGLRAAEWNEPREPFKIFGNSYYVGTAALSAILIASDRGHVLIDGDTAQAPPQIVANIRALGFRIEDVKIILNSHVHLDHAGGLAELQRLSGAVVKASPTSAAALKSGMVGRNDPQYGSTGPFPPVTDVAPLKDGEAIKLGPILLIAHFTPGHTAGGTTWTWDACEQTKCRHIVYADSLTAVSAPNFSFNRSAAYPDAVRDFERSFAVVSTLPCDILISAHPEVSDLWTRLDKRNRGDDSALIDATACRRYADNARMGLEKRLASEKKE